MLPYSLFAAVLATIAAGLSSLVDEDGLEPRSLRDLARSIDTSDVPMNAERRLEMMAGAQRMAHELKEQLESKDSDGRTPVHHAALAGMPAVLEGFLSYATTLSAEEVAVPGSASLPVSLLSGDKFGRTPLHLAVQSDKDDAHRAEKIACLCRYGYALEQRDINGATPLHLAAQMRSATAIKTLAQAGADLQAIIGPVHTALHLAVNAGEQSTVRALSAVGADLNAQDFTGYTPLHLAVIKEQPAIIRVLARAGAKLEMRAHHGEGTSNGATALQLAVRYKCLECVVALVEEGADIDSEASGIPPLEPVGSDEESPRGSTLLRPERAEERRARMRKRILHALHMAPEQHGDEL